MRHLISLAATSSLIFLGVSTSAQANFITTKDDNLTGNRAALTSLRADADGLVFIGDMAFDQRQLLSRGFVGKKWENGIIPIAFDNTVTSQQRSIFFAACSKWSDVAHVQCLPRTTEVDYIKVESGSGNWSMVGRVGGVQRLQIYNWNYPFIVAHEIGHALGAMHTQSRPDRDNYVSVKFENIIDKNEHNFTKIPMETHGLDYDFESIMHYGPYSFSENGLPTIEPKPGFEDAFGLMGNRRYFSGGDKAMMALQYGKPHQEFSTKRPEQSPYNRSVSNLKSPPSIGDDTRFITNAENQPTTKIWGGTLVPEGAFPHVVAISKTSKPDKVEAACSGTLITPDVVLTAKHCVCQGVNGSVLFGNDDKSPTAKWVDVKAQSPKVENCSKPVTSDNLDIGLLFLSEPSNVNVAVMANDNMIDRSFTYRAVGFGYTEKNELGKKREVIVPAASNDCAGSPGGWSVSDSQAYGCIENAEIVAGAVGLGRDTCFGDSGGPLFAGTGHHAAATVGEDNLRLAGVTSRAIRISTGEILCGDGGIYVRITENVIDWIDQEITAFESAE